MVAMLFIGRQIAKAGALVDSGIISSGGSQVVKLGGISSEAVFLSGSQHLESGGTVAGTRLPERQPGVRGGAVAF